MDGFIIQLFNTTVASSWLILGVIAVRLIVKKLPSKYRRVLWLLVLVRLILPNVPAFEYSLVPSAETVAPEMLYSPHPQITSGVPYLNSVVNPVIGESLAPDIGASVNPLQIISFLGSLLWTAGVTLLLLYAVISSVRLGLALRGSEKCGELRLTDRIGMPFTFGFPRPKIYIPRDLSTRSREYVVSHERAHIKNLDYLTKPLFFAVASVHWFNPLVWVAYALYSRDIELACDEAVTEGLSHEDKQAYLHTLVSLTSRGSGRRRVGLISPIAFGEVNVRERIKNIMKTKKSGIFAAVIVALLVVLLAVFLMTSPTGGVKSGGITEGLPADATVFMPTEILFNAPMYSFTYTEQNMPRFKIADGRFYFGEGQEVGMFSEENDGWTDYGELKEIELTKENFDDCCVGHETVGFKPENVRKAVKRAWQTVYRKQAEDGEFTANVLYLLLDNGEVYIGIGHLFDDGTPSVRWLFDVAELYSTTCIYMNPLSSFLETRKGYIYTYSVRKGEDGDEIVVTEIDGGKVVGSGPVSEWKKLSKEEWNSFFTLSFGHPEYNEERHDYIKLYGDKYLFRMGEKTLFGSYGGKKTGMWSLYVLKEPGGESPIAVETDTAVTETYETKDTEPAEATAPETEDINSAESSEKGIFDEISQTVFDMLFALKNEEKFETKDSEKAETEADTSPETEPEPENIDGKFEELKEIVESILLARPRK